MAVSGSAVVGSLDAGSGVIQTTGVIQSGSLTTTGNVTLASNANASVTVGNQNGSGIGTSTVSFNNNRLQNVATATAGTDAVNLNQANSLISSATTPIQNQVNGIQNQVNQNNLSAQRGIAGVSAIAGIPAIEAGKNFSIGIGVGNYVSASAISVGAQARLTQSSVLKIAAGTTSFGGIVTSAGLGFSF